MRSLLLAVLASVTKLKGDGIFHIKLDGGSSLTVERACLPQGHDAATTTSCDVAHDMGSYLKGGKYRRPPNNLVYETYAVAVASKRSEK